MPLRLNTFIQHFAPSVLSIHTPGILHARSGKAPTDKQHAHTSRMPQQRILTTFVTRTFCVNDR